MLKRKVALFAAMVLLGQCGMALAQQAVVISPSVANSGDASGSITATNVFQQVWAQVSSSQRRAGCLIINNSTDRQWVYFGAVPTKATSIPLEAAAATNGLGGFVSCATGGGGILQDQVWITGTINDTFVAKQQ